MTALAAKNDTDGFDFSDMDAPKRDETGTLPWTAAAPESLEAAQPADAAKAVEPPSLEDELEVGTHVDNAAAAVTSGPGATTISDPADDTAAAVDRAAAEPSVAAQPASASEDTGTRVERATLDNPDDPRFAAAPNADVRAAREALAAQHQAQQNQRQFAGGGGGGGGGGLLSNISPSVLKAGAAAAAGAVLVGPTAAALAGAAVLGGPGAMKLLANGLDKARPAADPSAPKRMSIAERIARRDPVRAKEYYANAGDEVVRENIYREARAGVINNVAEAEASSRDFASAVERFHNAISAAPEGQRLAEMAANAGTSIGDYVNKVRSGTVTDAAAASLVQSLNQNPDVTAAQADFSKAARSFANNVDNVSRNIETLDASFPGRTDTAVHTRKLKDLAESMDNQKPVPLNNEAKSIVDEITGMAKRLAEVLKNALNKVASALGSKAAAATP